MRTHRCKRLPVDETNQSETMSQCLTTTLRLLVKILWRDKPRSSKNERDSEVYQVKGSKDKEEGGFPERSKAQRAWKGSEKKAWARRFGRKVSGVMYDNSVSKNQRKGVESFWDLGGPVQGVEPEVSEIKMLSLSLGVFGMDRIRNVKIRGTGAC